MTDAPTRKRKQPKQPRSVQCFFCHKQMELSDRAVVWVNGGWGYYAHEGCYDEAHNE